ncbi:MAG TPA: gamma-glutamyltransferase, partial [Pirellulales bacterium]
NGNVDLLPGGAPPSAGQLVRNLGLARTLKALAAHGASAFYEGELAATIARAVQAAGGFLTESDLAAHRSTWDEPLSVPFHGLRVWECPPNGQGLVALLALNTLGYLDLGSMDDGLSPERWHLVIEALRQAFADARAHVADPAFSQIPLTELLSAGFAAERALQIDFERANLAYAPGKLAGPVVNAPSVVGTDTIQLVVVDRAGNACSLVNSNFMGFGTGIVPDGLGFSLQNRGHGFSLDPSHPNSLAPGKRPYHTIIPALATHESDGTLAAAFGVMGGLMQPQGHVQTLLGWRLDGLDPQATLDRPRFRLDDDSPAACVSLESGVPIATAAALAKLGHPVRPVVGWDRAVFGRGQMIVRDPRSGVLSAGSDMRADGSAAGW